MTDVIKSAAGISAEEMRRMGPLAGGHWLIGAERCPACHEPFKAGDFVTLIPIGPGSDPEERERARSGRFYNAVAVAAHWACVTGVEA